MLLPTSMHGAPEPSLGGAACGGVLGRLCRLPGSLGVRPAAHMIRVSQDVICFSLDLGSRIQR
jgi:hypothetical protein